MADKLPPFLRIPSEIRLLIYRLLLNDGGHNVFEIRNQDPEVYKRRRRHLRTGYRTLGRDLMRQSNPTVYHLLTETDMHTSIMVANKQIHAETAYILYGKRIFSFGRDVEAIVPFFTDLTLQTRPLIQEISLVKQGSVYARDYDRCEWNGVCEILRERMQIQHMELVVEGGRPSLGWEGLPTYSVADFKTLSTVRYEPLDWVWSLLSVKGLKKLQVVSDIHHCPPSHSSAMALFAAFSASIESGFAEFLRSEMLGN